MKENVLKIKTYDFAKQIIACYKYLVESKKEYILSKQLLRSGTSIGAMVRESEFAQSKIDFTHKLSVGLKEANETMYWLDLLLDSQYIEQVMYTGLSNLCKEIISILVSSIKTSKGKNT